MTSKNLDDEITDSRLARYNAIQPDIKHYLSAILTPHYPTLFQRHSTPGHPYDSLNLIDLLHDGEILCRLGQLVSHPQNPTAKFKSSSMAFIQMENISWFLQLCQLLHVPHDEIFQTTDLFEGKDPYQVCVTLMSFSRIVHRLQGDVFSEVVGPKQVRVKPTIPNKPRSLRQ
ncbi:uncharacterized protein LODBEIA_P25270 [Lodderomyces beijingensis]|uniref:Calponin-homology (CH) domain-containing protein n=1 Tax=Lodderomyces beijingensis TaxID=1775926 RepID=A0ABP0ZJI1_9ASCO